ncbi:MAG: efflux RND transporter periplasmic adaptor subunit [Planctomycetota bacterium]
MSVDTPAGKDMVPANAFNTLSVLHQLSLEAFLSRTGQELMFRILNRTVALCPYGRAVLWGVEDGGAAPLGVSGKADLNPRSTLMQAYARLVKDIRQPDEAAVLDAEAFVASEEAWNEFVGEQKVTSVLWLPLLVDGKRVAGLWLERWTGQPPFEEKDLRMLGSLVVAYAAAWDKLILRKTVAQRVRESVTRSRLLLLVLVALVLLLSLQAPLRIVAPCEVTPEDPVIVTAPLDGVVSEIRVEPGQRVEAGELLFGYESRGLEEELEVARQQLEIIGSELKRAKVQATRDPDARASLLALQNRYEQERIRLRAAEERARKLEVTAPAAGMVMIDAPHEWEGRPVAVGERVLSIVDPEKTRILVWLPEDDNIEFNREKPVRVFLKISPEKTLLARLDYVSKHLVIPPSGVPSYRAEAVWTEDTESPVLDRRMGLTGTAMLYGEEVSLAYWVGRKPYEAVRRFFGF